ncbi:MAG: hypothetical protein D6714_07630 [Bacteroidetes bacterium]|nr:MAG: hypothetical protein D6714_07630 [Bacteroidota bacterium]
MSKSFTPTIITLTTDYGLKDYSVGALKGALLQQSPNLNLVDISHQIAPFDIVQAAFIFKNAWPHFPTGTIHIISVNNYSTRKLCFFAIHHKGHFFIGPDNGIFSLIFDTRPSIIYELDRLDNAFFSENAIFSHAVGHIVSGKPFIEIGLPAKKQTERLALFPVIGPNFIRGSVIFIDRYENVILNIKKNLFDEVGNGRSFQLFFKRNDALTELHEYYYDVPVGEVLCFFNAADNLEIAINMGKAASLLGLNMDDAIEIRFL